MNLLFPIAARTLLIAGGVLAGLTIIAYILKMRRRRFEVPFSMLWQRVLKQKEATSLWRHLRRILSLLLILTMLAALVFAAAAPELGTASHDAKNVVIIIDASASMKTIDETTPRADGKVSRIDAAKHRAQEIVKSMSGGDSAMIMRMDGRTTPLSRFESDGDKLHRVIRSVQATDTPADLRRALSAAADALRERKNPMIILVGDGAYPEDVLDSVQWEKGAPASLDSIAMGDINLHYVPVGKEVENVGIIAFNVRRYIANKLSYEVYIEVKNFGEKRARRKLLLYSGQEAVDVKTIDLDAGETLKTLYPNQSGGSDTRLRAVLVPLSDDPNQDESVNLDKLRHDAFPLDDEAFALLPGSKKQDVLLVSDDNLYLEGAMLVYENIRVDKITPKEYDAQVKTGSLDDYHAVVFDEHTPEYLPGRHTHALYFHPTGEHAPFPITGNIKRPRVTDVNDNHLLMRSVTLSDVNFDVASVYKVNRRNGEIALAESVRAPIAAAKRDHGRKVVALGFSLPGEGRTAVTDIVIRVAFPMLLVNVLDWFAGDDSNLITTYTTGRRVRVPMDGTYGIRQVDVKPPNGKKAKAPMSEGNASFYADQVGVHVVTATDESGNQARIELAANLASPDESDIAPTGVLKAGGVELVPPNKFEITHNRSLWSYLVLFAALLLVIEWFTYNRRITV